MSMMLVVFAIWMKRACFVFFVRRYIVLLPSKDPTTIRGKKKLLDRVTLVVCCNATKTKKVPITMI